MSLNYIPCRYKSLILNEQFKLDIVECISSLTRQDFTRPDKTSLLRTVPQAQIGMCIAFTIGRTSVASISTFFLVWFYLFFYNVVVPVYAQHSQYDSNHIHTHSYNWRSTQGPCTCIYRQNFYQSSTGACPLPQWWTASWYIKFTKRSQQWFHVALHEAVQNLYEEDEN